MPKDFTFENKNTESSVIAGRNAVTEALKKGRPIDCIYILKGAERGSMGKIIALAKENGIPIKDAAQQKLDTLHALNETLPDPQLSAAMTRMEKAGRSIVETVEANPAKAKQVRRFANYYLPDAVNVLQQYAKLAKQGVRGENAAAIRAEVEHNAASIATAFENQLDALYAAESMDLSADLTVLQNMLKGQGLSK